MYTTLKFCAAIFFTATVTAAIGTSKESQQESSREGKAQNFVLFFIEPDLEEKDCENTKIGDMEFPVRKSITPYTDKYEQNIPQEIKSHTHKPRYNVCPQILKHCLMSLLAWAENSRGMSTASVTLHITEMMCKNDSEATNSKTELSSSTCKTTEANMHKPSGSEKKHRKIHFHRFYPIRGHQHKKRSYQKVIDKNFYGADFPTVPRKIRPLRKRNYYLTKSIDERNHFNDRISSFLNTESNMIGLTEKALQSGGEINDQDKRHVQTDNDSKSTNLKYPQKNNKGIEHYVDKEEKDTKPKTQGDSMTIKTDATLRHQEKRNYDTIKNIYNPYYTSEDKIRDIDKRNNDFDLKIINHENHNNVKRCYQPDESVIKNTGKSDESKPKYISDTDTKDMNHDSDKLTNDHTGKRGYKKIIEPKMGDLIILPLNPNEYPLEKSDLPKLKLDDITSGDNPPIYEVFPDRNNLEFNDINPYSKKDIKDKDKQSELQTSTEHVEDMEEAESEDDNEDTMNNVGNEKSFSVVLKIPGTGSLSQRKSFRSYNGCKQENKEHTTEGDKGDENNYKFPEHKEIEENDLKELTGTTECFKKDNFDEKSTKRNKLFDNKDSTKEDDIHHTTIVDNHKETTISDNEEETSHKEGSTPNTMDSQIDLTSECTGSTSNKEESSSHKSDESKDESSHSPSDHSELEDHVTSSEQDGNHTTNTNKDTSEDNKEEGGNHKFSEHKEESKNNEEIQKNTESTECPNGETEKNGEGKSENTETTESNAMNKETKPSESDEVLGSTSKHKGVSDKEENQKSEHKEVSDNTVGHKEEENGKKEWENILKANNNENATDRKFGNKTSNEEDHKNTPAPEDDYGECNSEDNNHTEIPGHEGEVNGEHGNEHNAKGNMDIFEVLSLMATIKNSFYSSMFGPGFVNDQTKFKNPSMYNLATKMIDQLNGMNNDKGYIAVIMGGKFSDFKNSSSDLTKVFNHLAHKYDKSNTTIVVSGSCPQKDQIKNISLLATGANCKAFNSVQELYDIPRVVKNILNKCSDDGSSKQTESSALKSPLPVIGGRRQILPYLFSKPQEDRKLYSNIDETMSNSRLVDLE